MILYFLRKWKNERKHGRYATILCGLPCLFICSVLFCFRFPKHFGCQKWKEEDTIENKMYQNRFPFYDSSGNSASADKCCNIVVHKMQDNRDPDVVCFHISKSKEYTQCNAGNKLCGNTLKFCIRCIVKQV